MAFFEFEKTERIRDNHKEPRVLLDADVKEQEPMFQYERNK